VYEEKKGRGIRLVNTLSGTQNVALFGRSNHVHQSDFRFWDNAASNIRRAMPFLVQKLVVTYFSEGFELFLAK